MYLKKALNGINVQLLNSLEYGDEIQLNDLYSLYHYSEDDCVVVNRTDDWTELVQVLWDEDDNSILFEVIDNDQYHIEIGKPYKDESHEDGLKYYDNLEAVKVIEECFKTDDDMQVHHPDFHSYKDEDILELGSKWYGIHHIGNLNINRLGNLEVTPDYESKYKSLKLQFTQLFKYMEENTTYLWRDDLECTHECVVLEDVHDGVKRDECDNPTMACTGTNVTTMIQHIQRTHLA